MTTTIATSSNDISNQGIDTFPAILRNHTVGVERLMRKPLSKINLKETISLLFHAIHSLYNKMNEKNRDTKHWITYYKSFLDELKKQETLGWPQLNIVKNNYHKRIDVYPSSTFLRSDNVLVLLHRLLFIENYKRGIMQDSDTYAKVLNHKISVNDTTSNIKTKEVSLGKILEMVKSYLSYYVSIYNDESKMEYRLGWYILDIMYARKK